MCVLVYVCAHIYILINIVTTILVEDKHEIENRGTCKIRLNIFIVYKTSLESLMSSFPCSESSVCTILYFVRKVSDCIIDQFLSVNDDGIVFLCSGLYSKDTIIDEDFGSYSS